MPCGQIGQVSCDGQDRVGRVRSAVDAVVVLRCFASGDTVRRSVDQPPDRRAGNAALRFRSFYPDACGASADVAASAERFGRATAQHDTSERAKPVETGQVCRLPADENAGFQLLVRGFQS